MKIYQNPINVHTEYDQKLSMSCKIYVRFFWKKGGVKVHEFKSYSLRIYRCILFRTYGIRWQAKTAIRNCSVVEHRQWWSATEIVRFVKRIIKYVLADNRSSCGWMRSSLSASAIDRSIWDDVNINYMKVWNKGKSQKCNNNADNLWNIKYATCGMRMKRKR